MRNTIVELGAEVRSWRSGGLPHGSLHPSPRNTRRALKDPLGLLLDHQRRHGPVFTIRMMHVPMVWAIGAQANHQILVSDFDAFEWRTGRFIDIWPLLGDGMLNIDGEYHRDMRRLMLPAFHHERVLTLSEQIVEQGLRAAEALQPGTTVDIYGWTREVALRIALRVLLGIETDAERERRLAAAFEAALSFHGRPMWTQMLRGPGTPFSHVLRARAELDRSIHAEIARRRRGGEPGPGVLGMLLAATDAQGAPLDADAIRDQAVTLLFAGHDTTTATLTFLLHELDRTPAAREQVEAELDAVLAGAPPRPEHLDGNGLPVLERAITETLRRFPAAWIGPRRTRREVTVAGPRVPAGVCINYSSWVTHHLPELYPDPFHFRLDRDMAALPRGAYVPFGGGSRMCLGKRFGEVELRALAAILLSRARFERVPGKPLRVATTPTLGPAGGLALRLIRRSRLP